MAVNLFSLLSKLENLNNPTIKTYHGGTMDGDQDTFFVATDKAQAQAYAQENEGPLNSFDIDLREIATDDTAMESISRLGIEPLDKNWRSSESSIYELLDPNFEQYIGKKNVKKLKQDLSKQGYKGIAFYDFDALTFVDVPGAPSGSGRQDAQNIALFEKPKLSSAAPVTTGLLGAAALQPEDAEAGLLNQTAKALRESSEIAKRTEADELGIAGGSGTTALAAPQFFQSDTPDGGMGVTVPPRPSEPVPYTGLLDVQRQLATEPTTQEKLRGILDAVANAGQALIAPISEAPFTLMEALTTDTPTSQIRENQARRLAQMDFQPGALGQQYTENAQRAIGNAINNSNLLNALGNIYDRSRILQTPERAINQLPDRARLIGSSLLSAAGL